MAPRLGAARVVLVAVLLVAAAAPTARAVGLSSPVTVSPPDGSADSPAAAMGPQGRTAVIWDEVTPVGASARAEVDARIGPAPDRLGPVVELAPVELGAGGPEVAVTAAGAALACWNDAEGGTAAIRCASSSGRDGFGKARTVYRRHAAAALSLDGLVADGASRFVLALSRQRGARRDLFWAAWRRSGTLRPRRLGTTAEVDDVDLAVGRHGEVVAAWPTQSFIERRLLVAIRPRGAVAFGRPRDVTPGRRIFHLEGAFGGHGLGLTVSGESPPKQILEGLLQSRRDRFNPIFLPVRRRVGQDLSAILFDRDGSPEGLSWLFDDAPTDCANLTRGEVYAVGLRAAGGRPTGPPRLISDPHQITTAATGVALADGTMLAVWSDYQAGLDDNRLEYAIRSRGHAFAPATPLPETSVREPVLAAGGGQALVLWETGRFGAATLLVMATLRRSPPYAPRAPRPAKSQAPCS